MDAMEWLEEVYDDHAASLYAFLLNLTSSEAEARDLLQEVFVKLARKPGLLRGVGNERAFLFRTGRNLFLDHCRRSRARERNHLLAAAEAELTGLFETESSAPRISASEVETALGVLPVEQRLVVHLKVWEKLAFNEIAKILSISPNTAASRYRYAIDKLRHRCVFNQNHHE